MLLLKTAGMFCDVVIFSGALFTFYHESSVNAANVAQAIARLFITGLFQVIKDLMQGSISAVLFVFFIHKACIAKNTAPDFSSIPKI